MRKSIYGQFIACNRFPKCMHTARAKKPDTKEKKKTVKKGVKK